MTANDFIFSRKYRLRRHISYWLCYYLLWSCYWTLVGSTFAENLLRLLVWMPVFFIYSYPIAYVVVPKLLLKDKYTLFILSVIAWGIFGWYFNIFFRQYVFFPFCDWFKIWHDPYVRNPVSFLCMTTTAGCMTISTFTKRWLKKQQEWYQSEKEKAAAQLQVLRAQLHPHFLFNTLNNIYAFALEGSPKTPQMILKLSSLLSYILYECRTDEVLLEKEVEVMKHYIDLEKERYGDKIDISVNIEGDIQDKYITPLLILPFLENAFKHGTSEQLERPWMSADITVKRHTLTCKIVNSKNEVTPFRTEGVGISNVKKRLDLLYAGRHDLKLKDEGEFFVVDLLLELTIYKFIPAISVQTKEQLKTKMKNEDSMLVNR